MEGESEQALVRSELESVRNHAREVASIIGARMQELYRDHFKEPALLKILDMHPPHPEMPSIGLLTQAHLAGIKPEVTLEIYHRLAIVEAFLEQASYEERAAMFKKALKDVDKAVYSLQCKVQFIMARQGLQLKSRVWCSDPVMKLDGVTYVTTLLKRRARDYVTLRDTKKLLQQVIIQELNELIRRLPAE